MADYCGIIKIGKGFAIEENRCRHIYMYVCMYICVDGVCTLYV